MSLAGGDDLKATFGSYSSPQQKESNVSTAGRQQAEESTEVLASGNQRP